MRRDRENAFLKPAPISTADYIKKKTGTIDHANRQNALNSVVFEPMNDSTGIARKSTLRTFCPRSPQRRACFARRYRRQLYVTIMSQRISVEPTSIRCSAYHFTLGEYAVEVVSYHGGVMIYAPLSRGHRQNQYRELL